MRRRVLAAVSAAAVVAVVGTAAPSPSGAQGKTAEQPCDIRTTERVVAVGDVHGAYEQFVQILRTAGLIDGRNRWTGGRARLVQTGDVLDRGADSRKVVDLLRKLEREAAAAGGRVHALLGNHEFMRLVNDWRYVSPGELRAFQNGDSADLRLRARDFFAEQEAKRAREEKRPFDEGEYRAQFMKEFPLGYFEMQLAFGRDGEYGKWVRSRVAAVKINGILFLHGGVSDMVADRGCAGLNADVQRELAAAPVPVEKLMSLLSTDENGPLWYRGMAVEPEAEFAATLETILQRLGARAVVVGHTPVADGRITARFGGKVVMIDTGMLGGEHYPRGVPSALEMRDGTMTAIYQGRRERIETPALQKTEHAGDVAASTGTP